MERMAACMTDIEAFATRVVINSVCGPAAWGDHLAGLFYFLPRTVRCEAAFVIPGRATARTKPGSERYKKADTSYLYHKKTCCLLPSCNNWQRTASPKHGPFPAAISTRQRCSGATTGNSFLSNTTDIRELPRCSAPKRWACKYWALPAS